MSVPARQRGGPLVTIVLLLSAWSGARAVMWQERFGLSDSDPRPAEGFVLPPISFAPFVIGGAPSRMAADLPQAPPPLLSFGRAPALIGAAYGWSRQRGGLGQLDSQRAAGNGMLWSAALRDSSAYGLESDFRLTAGTGRSGSPPFLPPAPAAPPPTAGPAVPKRKPDRWSLEAWAFWRQGSDAAVVSQGRVPIYGASQAGSVLQYRFAPRSRRDPRLYARAYRALVASGESELALGASARPFARVPLRVAGEVRYTDGAVRRLVRPAGYVVTEVAPIPLTYGAQLELYGQGGWVGGAGSTLFADGQASITREVRAASRLTKNALRLSIGAAAWGGAQEDAQRLDIGPTMRLDLSLGRTPARLSVDWRERVAGDARPISGLAATLSTQF